MENSTELSDAPSALLQDLIKERRAEWRRENRGTAGGIRAASNIGDFRDVRSSPIGPAFNERKQSRYASAMGAKASAVPKNMGAREQEQYIENLDKKNFDLKLEIFHIREKMDKMEIELEKMRPISEKYRESQALLDETMLECDKKDVAIQQAVSLILSLEQEVGSLRGALTKFELSSKDGGKSTSSDPNNSEPTAVIGNRESPTLEQRRDLVTEYINTARPSSTVSNRMPGFLRQQDSATSALRSLYNGDSESYGNLGVTRYNRPFSITSRGDDRETINGDSLTVRSPSLSCLSESSFVSIYGKHKEDGDEYSKQTDAQLFEDIANESEPELPLHRPQTRPSSRAPRPLPAIPFSERDHAVPSGERLQSIDQVLEHVPASRHTRHKSVPQQINTTDLAAHLETQKLKNEPSFAGSIFNRDRLPPTPDTLTYEKSSSINSSFSVIAERSLLDGTPAPLKSYSSLRPTTSSDDQGELKEHFFTRRRSHSDITDDADDDESSKAQRQVSESADPGTLLNTITNAMHRMGIEPPNPATTPYGSNMMFDGNEHFHSTYSSWRSGSRTLQRPQTADSRSGRSSTRALPAEWTSGRQVEVPLSATLEKKESPRKLRIANNLDSATQTSPRPTTPPAASPSVTFHPSVSPLRSPRSPRSSSVGPAARPSFAQSPNSRHSTRVSPRAILSASAGSGIPPKPTFAKRLFKRQGPTGSTKVKFSSPASTKSTPGRLTSAKISAPVPPIFAESDRGAPYRAHPEASSPLESAGSQTPGDRSSSAVSRAIPRSSRMRRAASVSFRSPTSVSTDSGPAASSKDSTVACTGDSPAGGGEQQRRGSSRSPFVRADTAPDMADMENMSRSEVLPKRGPMNDIMSLHRRRPSSMVLDMARMHHGLDGGDSAATPSTAKSESSGGGGVRLLSASTASGGSNAKGAEEVGGAESPILGQGKVFEGDEDKDASEGTVKRRWFSRNRTGSSRLLVKGWPTK